MARLLTPSSDHSEIRLFVSASIPDPLRWVGDFEPMEILDAVVSTSREVLAIGGTLVTAAHPTIAPVLLFLASEFPPPETGKPRIVVYQSRVFELELPADTRKLINSGLGDVRFTEAVAGETSDLRNRRQSLRRMRRQMLEEMKPEGAIFVGGMEGVDEEWEMVGVQLPHCKRYAFAKPGGQAARYSHRSRPTLATDLEKSDLYPYLADRVVQDLLEHE
ncbi:hypothetical protein BKA04_000419 [Cryobacterium mesophilum]|uniref:SLOG domain-containing protein n=1 Tax=Terrimesophilobacter mesophilus TaxID=433647 RepID=UPI0018044E14|nr:hypothetical protein [Terrimesophilobacter mesophilus]